MKINVKYLLGFILLFTLILGTKPLSEYTPLSDDPDRDSAKIEIQAQYDSLNILDSYSAHISTPVCEGSKCYTIEIIFHWDLIGRFQHFDTLSGKGLTKLDHIPFTREDYRKLEAILKNPLSRLAAYSNEELVKETRSSAIDGITGATNVELKASVIEGAVYSCHTLWHIAHGPMVLDLQSVTQQFYSQELVQKLVSGEDQGINYFLINSFSSEEFVRYLPEVLKTIEHGEGYFAKNAIEKMPAATVNSQEAQGFFAIQFDHFDYYAQVALLQKLKAKSLNPDLRRVLSGQIGERDSYKNDLIKSLLSNE